MARATVALAVLLAGCGSGGSAPSSEATGGGVNGAGTALNTAPCALGGASEFTQKCGLERTEVEGKSVVTLRHPDGGFRRLIELDGAKRYAAADGSDEAVIEANGGEIEVTLGDDHYLLPAPVKAVAGGR